LINPAEPTLADVMARLEKIEATVKQLANPFCAGHPFQHSFKTATGICTICGKPYNTSFSSTSSPA